MPPQTSVEMELGFIKHDFLSAFLCFFVLFFLTFNERIFFSPSQKFFGDLKPTSRKEKKKGNPSYSISH